MQNLQRFYLPEQVGILVISMLLKMLHLKISEVIVKYEYMISLNYGWKNPLKFSQWHFVDNSSI